MLPRRRERATQGLSRDKLQVLVRTVKIYSKVLSWHFIREVVPKAVTEQQDGGCCWGKCLKYWPEPPLLVVVLLWLGLLLSAPKGGMRQ